MAGHRRGTDKPTQQAGRAQRRTRNINNLLAAATTPRERVRVASEFLRSALAVNPDAVEAERLVEELIDTGHRLFRAREGATR